VLALLPQKIENRRAFSDDAEMTVLSRLFEDNKLGGVLFQKKNLSGYAGSFSRH
jgi:hypothetical protein